MMKEKSSGIILYYLDNEIPYFILLKYKTYWGFPKGIIENNENELETALRETIEETGINNIQLIKGFKYKQKWFFKRENDFINKEATFFLGKTTKEDAAKTKISYEHESFVWLPFNKALERLKIKTNKEMLEKAYEFIKKYEGQKKLA
ncbi:MAG: NUDIX domain-containing protein [Candidatus Pacearchaeota archaeon]